MTDTQPTVSTSEGETSKVQNLVQYESAPTQRYSLRARETKKNDENPPEAASKRKRATGGGPKKGRPSKKEKMEEKKEETKPSDKTAEKEGEHEREEVGGEHQHKHGGHEKQEEEIPKVLEKGQIYFLYRPKVEKSEVHSMDEVQRFFVLLRPYHHNLKRLLIIGNKHLPHPERHETGYAVVEMVSEDIGEIDKKHFEFDTYQTKTLGERHEFPARPVGEGLYAIFEHHGSMRLAYILELPEIPGQVQRAFDIKDEGSFIFTVKNPSVNETARRKDFPKEVLDQLGGKEGRRWAPRVHPDVLDHEGIEMMIVGAHHHLNEEVGAELAKELEEEAGKKARQMNIGKLLHELKMSKKDHSIEPLKLGQWA